MDGLSPDVLKTIYEFLPWRDRLLIRRLSSKFRCLLHYPVQLHVLRIQQYENTLLLMVKSKESLNLRDVIEIVQTRQKKNIVFSKTTEMEGKWQIQITTIRCPRPHFHRLLDVYLNLLLSICYFKNFELTYLNDHFLAKFRKTFHRVAPNFDWKKDERNIDLCSRHSKLTQEERKFTNFCKHPLSFGFHPLGDFKAPKDFWQLGAVAGTEQFIYNCGGTVKWNELVFPSVASKIDIEIDDEFIGNIIEKKMTIFICSRRTTVSQAFLENYIRNCVAGGHTLFNLILYHTLTNVQLQEMGSFLILCGFIKAGNQNFVGSIRRDTIRIS